MKIDKKSKLLFFFLVDRIAFIKSIWVIYNNRMNVNFTKKKKELDSFKVYIYLYINYYPSI